MEKKIVEIEILDNVKIITFDDGSQQFTPIEQPKQAVEVDNRSWWQKVCDWWSNSSVKPYVKLRDLADPTGSRAVDIDDRDAGCDGKNAAEIGIKIDF